MLNSIQIAVLRTLLPKVFLVVLLLMTSRILLASSCASLPGIPNNQGELGGFSSTPNLPLNVSDDKPIYTADLIEMAIFPALLSGLQGTCDEFGKYMRNHGVTDSEGKRHPGRAGVTGWSIKTKPDWKSQTTVEDISEGTGSKFEACSITSAPITPNFYAPTQIKMLDWNPNKKRSTTCEKEYQDWRKEVKRHENKHVKIAKDGAKEMNKNWKPSNPQFKVCKTGPSALTAERDARAALRKRVDSYLDKEEQKGFKKYSIQQEAFDKKSQPRPLDCRLCK